MILAKCYVLLSVVFIVTVNCAVIRINELPGQKCDLGDGILGRCEEITSCLNEDGIVRKNNTVRICDSLAGQVYVCCRKPYSVAETICNAWKSYWKVDEKCVFTTPLIVGGEDAGVGQFPEIVILGSYQEQEINWFCGGTLVSPHFVLTAAHCITTNTQIWVRFGEHDLFKSSLTGIPRVIGLVPKGLYNESQIQFEDRMMAPIEQTIRVKKIIVHPEHDQPYNDIALLLLERPVVITKRALPVCLPTTPEDDFKKNILTAAGWGQLSYHKSELSKVLQKVNIPVIERMECLERLQRLNSQLVSKGLTSQHLCAGPKNPGKDSCKGDSGGPLVLQINSTGTPACEHTQAGIVSFGPGCGVLGVYTRVSSYVEWITDYIAPGVLPLNKST